MQRDDRKRFVRFKRFHESNPRVFELFLYFCHQAKNKSNRNYFGARMIGERIRWYTSVETDEDMPKINDHYWPYYSRLVMLIHPDQFADFFQRRDERFDVDDVTLLAECG